MATEEKPAEQKQGRIIVSKPSSLDLLMPMDDVCARRGHNDAFPCGYTAKDNGYLVWYKCGRCGQERSEPATAEQVRQYFGNRDFGKHANSEHMKTHF